MAIFQYVNKGGVTSTIEANSPQEAMTKAPDIASDSGVMLVNSATPAQSQQTTTGATTPPATGGSGGLVGFKESLAQVTQLAKEKRNKLSLEFMTPFRGTVAASDFNSILSNLNTASDTTIKDAAKAATPTYKTDQVGSDLYQYQIDANGKIVGSPVKILSGEKGVGETEKAGLKIAQQKIVQLFDSAPRDEEGYVTSVEYRNARQAWVADGYSGADFDKIFSGQVNPNKAGDYGINFKTKVSSNDDEGRPQ